MAPFPAGYHDLNSHQHHPLMLSMLKNFSALQQPGWPTRCSAGALPLGFLCTYSTCNSQVFKYVIMFALNCFQEGRGNSSPSYYRILNSYTHEPLWLFPCHFLIGASSFEDPSHSFSRRAFIHILNSYLVLFKYSEASLPPWWADLATHPETVPISWITDTWDLLCTSTWFSAPWKCRSEVIPKHNLSSSKERGN